MAGSKVVRQLSGHRSHTIAASAGELRSSELETVDFCSEPQL